MFYTVVAVVVVVDVCHIVVITVFNTCFYGDSNFQRVDLGKRHFLCDIHSLMSAGFPMYLFMNDFLPRCLFAVVI